MKKLVYLLIWFLSRSPLFSFTLDKNFHEITSQDYKINDLRMSFCSFGLGAIKIYFLTIKKGEGFKIFKIIKLEDVQVIPNNEIVEGKTKEYANQIISKIEDDIEVEKEFLLYRINQEENKKNIALTKINNYIVIISILVPLLATNIIQAYSKIEIKYKQLLLIVTVYTLINVLAYILEFLKIKTFNRSRFEDIKKSNKHKNKIVESYYTDWYSIKEESTLYVALVRNVERYLKFVLIFTLCILFLGNFNNIYMQKNSNGINLKATNDIVNISLKSGQVDKEDLKKLTYVYQNLLNNNVREVMIIKNSLDEDVAKDQYDIIYNSLIMYNINKINLIIISEDDNKVKEPSIKLVLIGGKK